MACGHHIDEHWGDDDFAVLKIDMRNAFNVVSRQSLLSECAKHFPELRVPIGTADFCSAFISKKHVAVKQLLSSLEEVGAVDPQVAFTLLHICGGFCKLIHLARTAPPLHTTKAFQIFDEVVSKCFAQCTAVDTSDHAWHQARLSLSRGGLGLRSLAQHSPAAYIASLCVSAIQILLYHHQRLLTQRHFC